MLWIILIIVVALIMFIIGVYNNLITLRNRVKTAFAQIDTQLKRRFDLIPNLVETVKGYAEHEQETFEKVIQARNTYVNSSSVGEKLEANNQLTGTLKNLFALSESYPELKANENFKSLQIELTGTEDKIAFSRQFYNDTVQKYNTSIMTFPNNILAGMFNFKEEPLYKAAETERENVKVKF